MPLYANSQNKCELSLLRQLETWHCSHLLPTIVLLWRQPYSNRLPASPTAANPPHSAAVVDSQDRRTDTVPLHRPSHILCNTHTRFTALFPGLPGWDGTRKEKPIWILLKQETVSGSGISWAICKSAPRSRQITTTAPHHSIFTGRMPFLPPNQ